MHLNSIEVVLRGWPVPPGFISIKWWGTSADLNSQGDDRTMLDSNFAAQKANEIQWMRLIDSHGLFQGQNELAKEQQACTLAIGDVMVMSVQIDETGNTTPKTNTHTHKSQIASVFGCSWIMWSTTLILGSQKASWFQHLVDRCRLINAKVQEVGQLHFQLQEALAKVVGPSVFVGQWWCGKNRMVMSCVKQRRDKENKIG